MLGHADIKTTQVYTRVRIRALKDIHSATHPARLTRATLKLDNEPSATVADLRAALDEEAASEVGDELWHGVLLCPVRKRSGMQVFKTRMFARWADNEGVSDAALLAAMDER